MIPILHVIKKVGHWLKVTQIKETEKTAEIDPHTHVLIWLPTNLQRHPVEHTPTI